MPSSALTALLVRQYRRPVLRRHHRTSLHRATQVRRQYHSHNRRMRKPDPVPTTHVMKQTSSGGFSQDDDIPMAVTERRRKLRPRLPVDDDEESDGAQADEDSLAGSRVRIGTALVSVDTGTTRRRSAVVSTASRRSLIEDDEGR